MTIEALPSKYRIPVTDRKLRRVLNYHGLRPNYFEDKKILDPGCGLSDLGFDLALQGIKAQVVGLDKSDVVFSGLRREEHGSTRLVKADIANPLPIATESIDVVLATYSLPFWAKSPAEITSFYRECGRVLTVGGTLSIYPAVVSRSINDHLPEHEQYVDWYERNLTMLEAGRAIEESSDWKMVSTGDERLTAIKLTPEASL